DGALVRSDALSGGVTARTMHLYVWGEGPSEYRTTFDADIGDATGPHITDFYRDGHGRIQRADINDGAPRDIFYIHDQSGQVLTRTQSVGTTLPANTSQYYYYFGGKRVAAMGTLDTPAGHYHDEIAGHGSAPAAPGWTADFDQNYAPVNGSSPGNAATRHVVQAGDTLAIIAAGLWGDAALWYKIAQANGLQGMDANSALTAGRTLTIPNIVTNVHNNASTFQVYDQNQALGDVRPDTPFPVQRDDGCGVVGQILTVAVAVAVTVVTQGALAGPSASFIGSVGAGVAAGAAGSVASQGFAIATGQQDKFSFKSLAIDAISGGISGGVGAKIGGTGFLAGAARNTLSNVLTQGVSTVTGLQDKFSFTSVATAGIIGGISSQVNQSIGPVEGTAERIGRGLASGAAGAIAGAATRSALNGSSFGDNLTASIPSVIGATIGNAVAEEIGSPVRETRTVGEGADGRVPLAEDSAFGGFGNALIGHPMLFRGPDFGLTTAQDWIDRAYAVGAANGLVPEG
ncbi:MAG: LysM peptidoglycan-binding domain-containing protein, partial [Pseudomonadota bacterium]